jgi:hypothetical protein
VDDATAGEATASADEAPSDDAGDDEPVASADDATSDAPPEREDPVGSRMPGHASGGDD